MNLEWCLLAEEPSLFSLVSTEVSGAWVLNYHPQEGTLLHLCPHPSSLLISRGGGGHPVGTVADGL